MSDPFLLKIRALLACSGVILWIVSTLTFGFSWLVLLAFLGVIIATVNLVGRWLAPLSDLQRKSIALLGLGSDTKNNPFDDIDQALKFRDQLLDEQSERLAGSRERFNAVLSGMAEGVIAIDADWKILFLNRAATEILNISSNEIIGFPLIGVIRHEAVPNAIREASRDKRAIEIQFETLGSDRKEIIMRAAPMVGDTIQGMTLVFRDVTEINRLENVRREFVANVSHELKTPLASIKAYAETLLLGALEKPEGRKFVQQIEVQTDLLNEQVKDLLQIARVESGKAAFFVENINVNQTCKQCVERFHNEAKNKGIEILFESAEENLQITADREALQTILDNLVSNALRYSKEGSKIQIKTSGGDNVIIDVIDEGIGIAPEHQQRVFERFFRADQARSRDGGGTGLGLAIVKHLVQANDGTIELESKVGVGSRFRVCLPNRQQV